MTVTVQARSGQTDFHSLRRIRMEIYGADSFRPFRRHGVADLGPQFHRGNIFDDAC